MSRQYYCKRCSGELDEVHQRLDALEKQADFHNRRLGALESRGAGWNQAEESWREHPAQPPQPADPGEKWRELAWRYMPRLPTVIPSGATDLATEFERIDGEGYRRGHERGYSAGVERIDLAIAQARADERERVLEEAWAAARYGTFDGPNDPKASQWYWEGRNHAADRIATLRRGKP